MDLDFNPNKCYYNSASRRGISNTGLFWIRQAQVELELRFAGDVCNNNVTV